MDSIGAFEAKTHFSALLERVEKGEQVLITKHKQPVAKLVPVKTTDSETKKNAIQRLKQFHKCHHLRGLNWKQLRDEGRR